MSKTINLQKSFVEFGKIDRTKQKELKCVLMEGLKIQTLPGLLLRLKDASKNSLVENQWIQQKFIDYKILDSTELKNESK